MYVTPCGGTVATVVQSKGGACGSRVLSQSAQRRLLTLRGLGANPGGTIVQRLQARVADRLTPPAALVPATTSTVVTSLPTNRPTPPIIIAGRWRGRSLPPTTGTAITPTPPTGPAIPGSPVPQNYPTARLFVDAGGNTWQFGSATGQWAQVGTVSAAQGSGYVASTPVPVGTPTNTPYVDGQGNIWTYSSAAGTWVNASLYNSSISSLAAAQAAAAPAAAADPGSVLPSSAQSVLDWLSQQTLITGIPNWAIAAGAGFVALKLSQGRGR